jgi:hypothetical protein
MAIEEKGYFHFVKISIIPYFLDCQSSKVKKNGKKQYKKNKN